MAVKTRAQINADADTYLPDNTTALISEQDVRDRIKDLADSAIMDEDLNVLTTFNTRTAAIAYVPDDYDDAPNRVRTLGYGAANDGGGTEYKKVVSQPSHGLRFGMTAADATTVWYEIASSDFDARAAGVKFDNTVGSSTVNVTSWNTIIGFINSGTLNAGTVATVRCPPGRCYLDAELNDILAPFRIIGSGPDQTNISPRTSAPASWNTLFKIGNVATQVEGVLIENLSTNYYHNTTMTGTDPWVHIFHAKRVTVRNCIVTNCASLVHIGDADGEGADHIRFDTVACTQYAPSGGSAVLGIDGANCKFIHCTFTAGGAQNTAARAIKLAPPAGASAGIDSWKFYACEFNFLTNNVPILYEMTGAGSVISNIFHSDCLWDGGGTDTIHIHIPSGGTGIIRTIHFTGCRVTARPSGDCLKVANDTANPLTGVSWVGGSFQTMTGSAIDLSGTTDVGLIIDSTQFIKADDAAVPAVVISNTGGGFKMQNCGTGFQSSSFTVGYTYLVSFTGAHARSIITGNEAKNCTAGLVNMSGLTAAVRLGHIIKDNLHPSGRPETVNRVTTTGTTAANVVDAALNDNTTYHVRAMVVGRTATERASYVREATVYRQSAGGATILGTVSTPHTAETDATWDATIVVSGNNVRVQVQGGTGDTVNWGCNFEAVPVV